MNTQAKSETPQSSPPSTPLVREKTSKRENTDVALKTPEELADQYTFVQELGHGNQAHVYKALDKSNHKYVAIKQLRVDSIQTWKEYDLFMREAKTLKSLDIPGVVKFEDAMEFLDIEHPAAYIVQEYIPGRSLGEMMRANYRFTAQQIFRFAIKLLTILKRLHSHYPPIIHRDIKPSNILFKPQLTGDDFDLYLIDFGAVANPQIQSGGSTVAGTFGYMPPEQLMGKASPASDIYALGATIAYMLSGVEPASMKVSDFRLLIDPHLESIPKRVVATLRQMLTPDATQRLCDYDELIARFRKYANNQFEHVNNADIFDDLKTIDETKSYEERLKAVTAYCQEYAIDLWDCLSDQTPREIPKPYRTLNTKAVPDLLSVNNFLLKAIYPQEVMAVIIFGIILSVPILGFAIFIFQATIPHVHNILSIETVFLLVAIILISIPFVFFYKCYPRKMRLNFTNAYHQFLDSYESFLRKRPLNKDLYEHIIKYGQKTIATIVDISYKSADPMLIEKYSYKQYNSNKKSIESSINGYCHQFATFTIRYKFNPPDDSSPYDLIHEVTTYTNCELILAQGDPLPIIYYFDKNNNREVWSTPFPIPYSDFLSYNNIIGHSNDMTDVVAFG